MKSTSVSVIGSFRKHHAEIVSVVEEIELSGLVVNSPKMSEIIDSSAKFPRFESDPPQTPDHQLQEIALDKILSSDVVYVVNPTGELGPSTALELGHVLERGLPVFYMNFPTDPPFGVASNSVISPSQLVSLVLDGKMRRRRVKALNSSDLVVLTIREDRLSILLVVRGKPPYKGMLALPGGFLRHGESLEQAAHRELAEETGLVGSRLPLRQFRTYSDEARDPRDRVITTAFLAVAPNLPTPSTSSDLRNDARSADWVEVEDSLRGRLSFDHWQILSDALERTRQLLEHTTVAVDFCDDTFPLSALRRVYEIIWGIPIDAGNFRRKVLGITDFVEPTGNKRTNHSGRPAELYRRGTASVLDPPFLRLRNQRATPSGG